MDLEGLLVSYFSCTDSYLEPSTRLPPPGPILITVFNRYPTQYL